jgi:hypothetical protein
MMEEQKLSHVGCSLTSRRRGSGSNGEAAAQGFRSVVRKLAPFEPTASILPSKSASAAPTHDDFEGNHRWR